MKDQDWKHIQGIVEHFLKGHTFDDGRINPILAYYPDTPVKIKEETGVLAGIETEYLHDASYSHLATAIEKNGKIIVAQKTFLVTEKSETQILSHQEEFKRCQARQAESYFNEPIKYFEKPSGIRVMTFKNSRMKEEEFKDIIELWRTQPPRMQN
tara:strand:- start:296 stop:760 length:465 start_codon:yes stop_codon:yes gene_type:complete